MTNQAAITLNLELDMVTALRFARFDTESGVGLVELLDKGVSEWEKRLPSDAQVHARRTVPVQFTYAPRAASQKVTTRGLFDPQRDLVQITESEFDELVGREGSPSRMAIEVVQAVSPKIVPNRNGRRDWRESATGRPIGEL